MEVHMKSGKALYSVRFFKKEILGFPEIIGRDK